MIEWKEPIVKRIGFERVEIEWQRIDEFKAYPIGRVLFEVNDESFPYEKYEWTESKLIK